MKQKGFFITGTDTNVGKTRIALGLAKALRQQNYRVATMKPVACGNDKTAAGPRNQDAVLLMNAASDTHAYHVINPYNLALATSPNIAAEQAGIDIDLHHIQKVYRRLAAGADFVIVEGAGGWMVPLSDKLTTADLAEVLDLPVILVVGIRLGCLNHALLTNGSVRMRGMKLAGWVANIIEPNNNFIEENIKTLKDRIEAPLLATVPYLNRQDINHRNPDHQDPDVIASQLALETLL